MNNDQLINKTFLTLQRNKILKDNERFIYTEINKRIIQSISDINLNLKKCLELGSQDKRVNEYIFSKYPNIKYHYADISKKLLDSISYNDLKICFDIDKWVVKENLYDLIVSNLYLHLSDNFEALLKNIYYSLNKNGFFIATIPGRNSFHELKNSMIEADINMYDGSYKRFMQLYSTDSINSFLKKNNFMTPIIDIDNLVFYYKNLSDLLKDIRFLGNSYFFNDRKKTFEKKLYFKQVEEIYMKKYSNNQKLVMQIQIIYITGWK